MVKLFKGKVYVFNGLGWCYIFKYEERYKEYYGYTDKVIASDYIYLDHNDPSCNDFYAVCNHSVCDWDEREDIRKATPEEEDWLIRSIQAGELARKESIVNSYQIF